MNKDIETNGNADQKKESWSTTSNNKDMTCPATSTVTEKTEFYLSECKPIDRNWIKNSNNDDIKGRAQIFSDTIDLLYKAKDISDNNSILKLLTPSKDANLDYLQQYVEALSQFENMIDGIIDDLNNYIDKDNGGLFFF